jgi:hypothetical protein
MSSYTPQKSDKFTFGLWTVRTPVERVRNKTAAPFL